MKYFYYDAARHEGVQSADAIEGQLSDILAVWDSLSRQSGSFLGVFGSSGVAVQFMWEDSPSVLVDVPMPDMGGSFQKLASPRECAAIIAEACSGGDPTEIPGLRFVTW